MSLDQEFVEAQEKVKTLSSRPGNDTLLKLYALYKQASIGNVSGSRPGMFDMKGRAKYDAWAGLKGKASDDAKQEYIDFVESLLN